MKRALRLALIVLAIAIGASADDTDLSKLGAKPKAKKAAVPKPKPKPTPIPTPSPLCIWTPQNVDPCDCWFWEDSAATHIFRPCLPRRAMERVEPLMEELPIKEAPPPPPPPLPTKIEIVRPRAVSRPLRLTLQGWTLAGFSGAADSKFTYGGRVSADGPVATTGGHPLRMFTALDISAIPGESFDVTSPETFSQAATLRGGTYLTLAESIPDGDEQLITTSVVLWGGFATMFDDQVQDKYKRSFGVGVRLAEEVSGAYISVSYCRDEAGGYIGFGQVCIAGNVPLVGTRQMVVLGGNALLNLSRAAVSDQRDYFNVYIGVDVGALTRR